MKKLVKKRFYAQVKKQGNSKCIILQSKDFHDLEVGSWVQIKIEELK